jgi:hypothetical protein
MLLIIMSMVTNCIFSQFVSLHYINSLVIFHLISDDKTIVKLLPLADDDENATTFINANYIPVSTYIKYNLYNIHI